MKIVITGASGLLGRHAAIRLHARNCASRFAGAGEPFDIVALNREHFTDRDVLVQSIRGADAVLHFAGINRGPPRAVEAGNPHIASELVSACATADVTPHIVHANSTHADSDTPYGRSKRRAADILRRSTSRFADLILPHIFGEGAKAYYNNVTATFIDQVINGQTPTINPGGEVALLHAGVAADHAIRAVVDGLYGTIEPAGRWMRVPELHDRIAGMHSVYQSGCFPDLAEEFDLALFNCYRTALYPDNFPRALTTRTDSRGVLFEAAKGGGGGQTFLSWTEPGVTRGNHFHLRKVERFVVVKGEGVIRIRPVLGEDLWECRVSGKKPVAVDMPTLHTHSIENVGDEPLLTLFWANEVFDPDSPDTYADPVMG